MTTNKNKNLRDAKRNKNDEFYTRYDDVVNELMKYEDQLRDKPILMPCDHDFNALTKEQLDEFNQNGIIKGINDGFAFSRFFINRNVNDEEFLKISPGYKSWNNQLYYSSYDANTQIGTKFQDSIREFAKKHPDGIVVTNPPFSLFREFIDVLIECNLKFIVMGDKNSIIYKNVSKLIKNQQVWWGYSAPKDFIQPKDHEKKTLNGRVRWYTNIETTKRKEKLMLIYEYEENKSKYLGYDNYNAINVDKVNEIPSDYEGYMGVPITFLDKYNPEQFEIICVDEEIKSNPKYLFLRKENQEFINTINKFDKGYINNKRLYARIIIKNKNPEKLYD